MLIAKGLENSPRGFRVRHLTPKPLGVTQNKLCGDCPSWLPLLSLETRLAILRHVSFQKFCSIAIQHTALGLL